MSVEGKTAIVTGASSGIGRATTLRFAREGASVVAVGRDEGALMKVMAAVAELGGIGQAIVADVTAQAAPERIVEGAVEAFGGVDILVNAAGIIGSGTIEETTDAAWDAMLDVNLRAPFRLIRACAPRLAEHGGAVVNVSSVTGLRAFHGILAYCVGKAGLDHLTRCTALELAPKGIRVNSVNPGVVVTDLHRRAGMDEPEYLAFLDRARATHPLGRVGQVEEVAELILFLASDRSAWLTGETIAIDGGRHLTCAR